MVPVPVAVPLASARATVMAPAAAFDRLTVNWAKAPFSDTLGLVTEMVGALSLSTMVPVPVAEGFAVVPVLVVAVSVKVSSASSIASLVIGVRTSTLVVPGAKVALVPSTQVVPPSTETWRLPAPSAPKSMPPPVAVPLASARATVMAPAAAFDRLTVNWAKAPFSDTLGLVTEMVGALSLSTMVPVPVAEGFAVVPVLVVAVSVKVSSASSIASLVIGVRTSTLVVPGAKVALVPSTQVVPPSTETWRLPAPSAPKSMPPPVAVPLASARATVMAPAAAFDRLTVNWAKAPFSDTLGLVTEMVGALSLSTMVPVPVAEGFAVVPVLVVAVSVKVSSASSIASLVIGVRTSTLVVPGAKVALVPSTQVVPPSTETWRLPAPSAPKSMPPPVAVPLASARATVMAPAAAFDRLTVNWAKAPFSDTLGLVTEMVGALSLSTMVPVPVAEGFAVVPVLVVAVSVKVSSASSIASLVIGVRTSTLVVPGAKVALVPSTQVVPPSTETWRLPAPSAPKSMPPPVAVPLASARATVMAPAAAFDRLTVNWAKAPFSDTLGLVTEMVGALSLSTMVPVPVAEGFAVVPVLVVAVSVKVSSASSIASLVIGVRTSTLVVPGAKVALVPSTQVVPPSTETWRLPAPSAPKSMPPPVAVPLASARATVMAPAAAFDRLTVNWAKAPFSDTLGLVTEMVGALSLSTMVPVPVAEGFAVVPVLVVAVSVKVSSASSIASLVIGVRTS